MIAAPSFSSATRSGTPSIRLRKSIKLQSVYHDAVRETIDEGCRSGEFSVRDVSITTMAVLDMLNGVREWFDPGGTLTRSELVGRYTDIVMTILGAQSPR
jgi:hypothetical protein